ncbi:hypothetical protein [Chromatium okenii]|nr:hypothetical protein [Chromatium okenii]
MLRNEDRRMDGNIPRGFADDLDIPHDCILELLVCKECFRDLPHV